MKNLLVLVLLGAALTAGCNSAGPMKPPAKQMSNTDNLKQIQDDPNLPADVKAKLLAQSQGAAKQPGVVAK